MTTSLDELLKESPKNWGRWGPGDEVGALNFLGSAEVLAGAAMMRQGRLFTLQMLMCDPQGDPIWPGRPQSQRYNTSDEGQFLGGKVSYSGKSPKGANDIIVCSLQATTQYDALGHAWIGDQIYNGYDSKTTIGSLSRASVVPIAEKGIAGRAVLLDVARHRGKESLEPGETITHKDLLAVAESQGVVLRPRDILMLRTGWLEQFRKDPRDFYEGTWNEPGLTYSPELVEWFHDMEIPNLVTDTLANEVTHDPVSGTMLPLHIALMCYLGIAFTEIASLDRLAADCAEDGQYDSFYVAAPLKIHGAAGSPVNPVVIK